MIANFQFAISDWARSKNRQSAFGNWKCPETPIGGQGAQCPDRLIAKKAANPLQIFSE